MLQRLVEQQDVRVLQEELRDARPLALPAGKRAICLGVAIGQVELGEAVPRGRRAFLVPAPGAPRARIPAEHDVVEHATPEIGFLVLEQHGDAPGELAARVRGQRDAVERDGSGLRGAQSGESEDEARLARAVAPEKGPESARREREVGRANELAPARGESESCGVQHQRSLHRRKSSAGTPIAAGRTPTGSSAGAAAVRASVSARASRLPPRHAESGSSAPWRCMPESRRRWGTTRPTKPIEPPSRTAATVASVAQPKAIDCSRVTATPSERALSSPRISTSSAADCEKASAAHAASTMSATLGSPAGERSPSSQKSIPCTCEKGASESINPTSAPNPEASATPVSSTRYGFHPERPSENAKTAPAAIEAPASAARFRPAAPTPSSIAASAPAAAPPETPRMAGSASGFLRSTWSSAPASARSPPQANPASALGARTPQTISRAISSPRPRSASASCPGPRSTLPNAIASARLAGTSATTKTGTIFIPG